MSGVDGRGIVYVSLIRRLHGVLGGPGLPRHGNVDGRAVVPVKPLRVVGEADQLPRRRRHEGQVETHRQQSRLESGVIDLMCVCVRKSAPQVSG